MANRKANLLEISDIRVKYDKKDGSLRITSKDPELKGKPFSLTLTGDSPTAETLFELMRAHGLIEAADLPTNISLKDQAELQNLYDAEKPLRFVLGETYGGELTKIDLSNSPHMLVSGASEAGKSVLLRGIAKQISLRENFRLSVFDPTGVQWSQDELRSQDRILRSNETLAAELEDLEDELQHGYSRAAADAVSGAPSAAATYKVLMLDYASHFLLGSGIDKNDEVAVAKHELAKQRLFRLLRLGRSSGIYVIFSTQNFDFETFPNEILAVVPIRVAMGSSGYLKTAALLGEKASLRSRRARS
jgi:S-DNA-T family DNA segregation ATPase FtsK/SpoIIIE